LYKQIKGRLEELPYKRAIQCLTEIEDISKIKSPFEMIQCVSEISQILEDEIQSFWKGITTINHENLLIDGDNILMLHMYIVLRAHVPNIFAYMKAIQFNTTYVRSVSRHGYCLTVLEIALEKIISCPLQEILEMQRATSSMDRARSFSD